MNAPIKLDAWEAELMAYVAESNARYRAAKAAGALPQQSKRSADQADLEDYADEQGRMPDLNWENV
jgi:hypothetical protein